MLLTLALTVSAAAQAQLKLCWERKTEAIDVKTAKDMILLVSENEIEALSLSGDIIWKSSYGGRVAGLASSEDKIAVVYRHGRKTILRLVSPTTGLSLSQSELKDEEEPKILSFSNGRFIVVLKSVIYAFDREGKILERLDSRIAFTSSPENIIALENGEKALLIPGISYLLLPHEIEEGAFDGQKLYFTEKSGTVVAYDTSSRSTSWKYRTGAKISSFVLLNGKVVAASRDNFVYLLSKEKGKVMWKKRFNSAPKIRAIGNLIIVYEENKAYVVNMSSKKPKVENVIENESEIISVSFLDGSLFILTPGRVKSFRDSCQDF